MKKVIYGLDWIFLPLCYVSTYNLIFNLSAILTYDFYLEVALDREVEGDLFLQDVGQGMGFRPGTFDGAIR